MNTTAGDGAIGARRESRTFWIATLVLLGWLFSLRFVSYLLFHVTVELIAIAIAWAVALVSRNRRAVSEDRSLVVLGAGYWLVGTLDLIHTLCYEGMNIVPSAGAPESTQLWLAARAVEAVVLMSVPLQVGKRGGTGVVVAAAATVLAAVTFTVFVVPVFPVAYVPGSGLTRFKIVVEYAIIAALGIAGVLIRTRRRRLSPPVARLLLLAIAATMLSEFMFTAYRHPYGTFNMAGHMLKVVSFVLVYRALVGEVITRPMQSLFVDLKRHQEVLERRDEVLAAVAEVGREFVEQRSGTSLVQVLGQLGRAAGAHRAYIFENHHGADGSLLTTMRHEWTAAGVEPMIGHEALQGFSYDARGFGRWREHLALGRRIHGPVDGFPDSEREALRMQGIVSLAVAPIHLGRRWWGFVGFDDCEQTRVWSNAELDALETAGHLVAAFIARRRNESQLQAMDLRYRSLFELSLDPILVLDGRGVVREANERAEHLTGLAASEMTGRRLGDLLAPEEASGTDALIRAIFTQGSASREADLVGSDDRRISVAITGATVYGDDDACVVVIRDVSQQRRLERGLLNATETERSRLGRELHDGVCQELKSLEIQASLLDDRSDASGEFVSSIRRTLDQAYAVARGLLPAGISPASLGESLRAMLDEVTARSGTRVRLRFDDDALPASEETAYQIYQIVREGLLNAINHGHAANVEVSLTREAGHAMVRIGDDGRGIDVDTSAGPTGLGIPVMRARAQAIGASLVADRRPGGGSLVVCRSRGPGWQEGPS